MSASTPQGLISANAIIYGQEQESNLKKLFESMSWTGENKSVKTFETAESRATESFVSETMNVSLFENYELLKRSLNVQTLSPVKTAEGSFNKIENFVVNNKKITIRMSKERSSCIMYKEENVNGQKKYKISIRRPYYYRKNGQIRTKDKDEILTELNEANLTKENWFNASHYKIAPEIISYGYFLNTDGGLQSFVVSETFNWDLHTFYNEGDGRNLKIYSVEEYIERDWKEENNEIARQLSVCFWKMINFMKILCYDIKPLNAVIKINDDGSYDVKLIDWDADWCIYEDKLHGTSEPKRDIRDLYFTITLLHMSNVFMKHVNYNIFWQFFKNIGFFIRSEEQGAAMKFLYEQNVNNSYFMQMARHYLENQGYLEKILALSKKTYYSLDISETFKKYFSSTELAASDSSTVARSDNGKTRGFFSQANLEEKFSSIKSTEVLNKNVVPFYFYINNGKVHLIEVNDQGAGMYVGETDNTTLDRFNNALNNALTTKGAQGFIMTYDPVRPYMVYATAYIFKDGIREDIIISKKETNAATGETLSKRPRRGGKKTRKIRKVKQ